MIRDMVTSDAGPWECEATNSAGVGTGLAVLNYIGELLLFKHGTAFLSCGTEKH